MNLYFLVEGKTERKIYPKWLKSLLPNYRKVSTPNDVTYNSYYLIGLGGFPRILDVGLPNSIADIKDSGNYDYLVLVLDADELTVEERLKEVNNKVDKLDLSLGKCEIKIIVQNKCIESWLLGNRKVFKRQPEDITLRECIKFFDVYQNDPELMGKPPTFVGSVGDYHYDYCKLMLASRNINYSKNLPRDAAEPYFLDQIRERLIKTPDHLKTLQDLIEFCQVVKG